MKNILFTVLFCLSGIFLFGQTQPGLIPYPAYIETRDGEFILSAKTQLQVNDQGKFTNEIFYLQSLIKTMIGNYLSSEKGENLIEINYSQEVIYDEGYTLDISPTKITISAKTPTGAFYAIQTIRQLLPVEVESGIETAAPISLPQLYISDQPAFEWRGSMIDVSRHFFSIEYLKKHIDRLALYKMNKLHLHLTDDQGWRVEIKQYPKLTEENAWRNYNNMDSALIRHSVENPDLALDPRYIIKREGENDLYGGYFTQDQVKDLIRYAESKHVEIIPEIDMPGHISSVIASYPELSCIGKTGWGDLFSVPLCVCDEEVYTFLENIISEIIDLFPSKYIHIGADEVDKTTWEESAVCKELMERESIGTVDELQSYFVKRIQQYIESKGKQVIAWDEVLDGGVDSNINIMYWRGWLANGVEKAANNGNRVIMSPTFPLYFDFLPDKSALYRVYHMDVIYNNVPKDKVHLIKGAQANLWSQATASENHADFMLFPRMTALAERVWTNKEMFESYEQRLLSHYPRLEALGVKYRLPDILDFAQESIYVEDTFFNIKSPLPTMKIHYTTDGSMPNTESPILDKPLKINNPQQIKFALFNSIGTRGEIYTIRYSKGKMNKSVKVKHTQPGLACDFFDLRIDRTSRIKGDCHKTFITQNISVPPEIESPSFGLIFKGYINIPETGIYSFYCTSDDAGMLYIDDKLVIDNEGPHTPMEKSGQIALEKGLHPIRIDFVEGGGGYMLQMEYSFKGESIKTIPDNWFVH